MKICLFKKKHCLLLCILFILISTGCLKKEIKIPQQVQKKEKQEKYSPDVLRKKADSAWIAGSFQEAQQLYKQIKNDRHFKVTDRKVFWERYVEAFIIKEQYSSSYTAVLQWSEVDPTIIRQPTWQELWGFSVLGLPRGEAIDIARNIWENLSVPTPLRGIACGVLMVLSPKQSKDSFAETLAQMYIHTDYHTRIMLEQRLLALFKKISYKDIVELESITSPEKDYMYPWSIIILAMVHREWKNKSDYTADLLGRINYTGIFSDSSLLSSLYKLEDVCENNFDSQGAFFHPGCYALALPMSGAYSSIGWKIAKGANIAQKELCKAGIPVEVLIVNTEASEWLDKLASLPPQCVIVGGPLRTDVYSEIKKQGLLKKKVFLTFLPSIENDDEGNLAWRFFSSPEDQIHAILSFSQMLNITKYGVVYPEDTYGRNMAKLFVSLAEQKGFSIVSINYDPTDTKEWGKIFSKITGSRMVGKIPVPATSCQALFLPDSWKNIEILMPYLFFQGEDRLILAGTSLWEQNLIKNKNIARNMDLAIFPGGWDVVRANAAAASLIEDFSLEDGETPDFWVALGYDFVRFASALNFSSPNWTVAEVNSKLENAPYLNWSMAQIFWEKGKAKQHLMLFQPTSTGYKLVDIEKFKKRLKAIQVRHEKRAQAAAYELIKSTK